MYSTTVLSLLLISSVQVQSFSPTSSSSNSNSNKIITTSTSTSTTKLSALTSDDILKRARKAAGVEEEPEPEPIFNEMIMNDFQQSLLLLEKRVKEGPASLSSSEVQNLDVMLNRIVTDMREHNAGAGAGSGSGSAGAVTVPAVPVVSTSTPYYETSDEEGDPYAGKGGLGLAKGTANTYLIDGMDEMSPEEYRKALQESVSARQVQRRQSGSVGNLSSNNYLDNLGK